MACIRPLACLFLTVALIATGCTKETEEGTAVTYPTAPVIVIRDSAGVPHIRAKTLQDAAYGQGYAQAQDRLLQMDLLRRTAQGQQAELLGEDALELDKLVRAINLPEAARQSMSALSAHSLSVIDGYVAGVNRYLDDLEAGANGTRRTADLDALDPDYVPRRWQRLDVVSIATAATFSLSSQITDDLVLTTLRELHGDEAWTRYIGFEPLAEAFALTDPATDKPLKAVEVGTDQFPVAAATGTFVGPPDMDKTASALRALGKLRSQIEALKTYPGASNNWAVSADKSASGKAMLASDPHGGISIPSSFHEAHLVAETEQLNVYGIAVIGAPAIHIGTNGQSAWAFTNLGADVGDLYYEDLSDRNRTALVDGKTVKTIQRVETILVRPEGGRVADAEAIQLELIDVPGHPGAQ